MTTERARRIYFDANIFIYAMETDTEKGVLARRWFTQVDRGEIHAVTSELTLAELLPHPIATGDHALLDAYHRLFGNKAAMDVLPVSRAIVLQAARLRATAKIELPDALHIATATEAGCNAFLTEDARLRMPDPLKRLTLQELGPVS